MRFKHTTWLLFIALALFSLLFWFLFRYPLYTILDLSVNRHEALKIAQDYLKEKGADLDEYRHAVIFTGDYNSDRYLQRTIGFEKEKEFIKKHDFEFFYWVIRFFKEGETEEYRLTISSATGEVTTLRHSLDPSAARRLTTQDEAKEQVIQFLKEAFNFNPDDYVLKSNLSTELDNRVDHSFTWARKDVYIPWNEEKDTGGAKLLIGATIAGDDVLSFAKTNLEIPDQFWRNLQTQQSTGRNILTAIRIFYMALFVGAIFFLVIRRNHIVMHTCYKFYVRLTAVLFLIALMSEVNQFEHTLFNYDTTQPFQAYFWRYTVDTIVYAFFTTIGILFPCLTGESLHYETLRERKHGSLLFYIRTTFLSREIFYCIGLGYLVCIIMLGIQALAFEFGRQHFGVWLEYTWVTQLSSTYWPFLAAVTIGLNASIFEEVIFRLFAISLGKKIIKSTVLSAFFAATLWGFGHSGYLIFPMWFRGIEVTVMGIFLSFIYLRYGIIPVLVAHYLFDVFLLSTGFLIGKSDPFYFYGSLVVLLVPLAWGLVAFAMNRQIPEKELRWKLNKHQVFNLDVLMTYLQNHPELLQKPTEELKKEVIKHGWDIAVVDMALEDLNRQGRGTSR